MGLMRAGRAVLEARPRPARDTAAPRQPQEDVMQVFTRTAMTAVLLLCAASAAHGQGAARTLVSVWAHPDDESSVAPVLARYAREGVQVYIITATDGSQGAANTSVPRGPEIAKLRVEEARCSASALGARPPILLGLPDGWLGSYRDEPKVLFRLTQRLQEEIARLRPDVVITWGPDGGSGHPDHRLVSAFVTQLARAGAPGMPPQVFYASIPEDAMRALNPDQAPPPYLAPQASLFSVRVAVTDADLEAARRSMGCHKTQFPDALVEKMAESMRNVMKGSWVLSPMVPGPAAGDLFPAR
jgi:LmbE family N-acetylglucosaminyl deacetylase